MTGIAIAFAATVGFFMVKRHSWLLAAPLSFGLSFSVIFALIEGWNTQLNVVLAVAQVALVLGAIGVTAAGFVILRRLKRASRDITREIGENNAHEGLFRDDDERIIVYATRKKVVLQALTTLTVLALFVIAACLGLLLCLGGVSSPRCSCSSPQ